MGLSDRRYAREDGDARAPGRSPFAGSMSATGWLILINVAVFVVEILVVPPSKTGGVSWLREYGWFSTQTLISRLEVWRVVTFQFLHGDPVHLALNMFGLWVFGRTVEEHLGRKRYLAFYLVCGICGALMYLVLNLLAHIAGSLGYPNIPILLYNSAKSPLIGASAGVFGVIVASAYFRPNDRMQLLFFPATIRLSVLAYTYVAIAAINLLFGRQNKGGEAAHLGGAVAGFFFVRNAHLLRDFFDVFQNSRKPGDGRRDGADPPRATDAELDRILGKIREQGMSSLTDGEKQSLRARTDQAKRRSGVG